MKIFKALLFTLFLILVSISQSFAAPGYSTTLRNARQDAITTVAGSAATLTGYSGSRPATCGTATTPLFTFTMGTPFAPASSGGVLTVTLPSATTGLAGAGAGTAVTWLRLSTSGSTCVADMSAGTSGADINLSTTTISTGLPISMTSWTITAGNP